MRTDISVAPTVSPLAYNIYRDSDRHRVFDYRPKKLHLALTVLAIGTTLAW